MSELKNLIKVSFDEDKLNNKIEELILKQIKSNNIRGFLRNQVIEDIQDIKTPMWSIEEKIKVLENEVMRLKQ